jgi:hypothetical protein
MRLPRLSFFQDGVQAAVCPTCSFEVLEELKRRNLLVQLGSGTQGCVNSTPSPLPSSDACPPALEANQSVFPVRAVITLVCVLFGIAAVLERNADIAWLMPSALCAAIARWLQLHDPVHWRAVYVELGLAIFSLSSLLKAARDALWYSSCLLVAFAALAREWSVHGQGTARNDEVDVVAGAESDHDAALCLHPVLDKDSEVPMLCVLSELARLSCSSAPVVSTGASFPGGGTQAHA